MVDAKLLTYSLTVSGSFQHWEGKECKEPEIKKYSLQSTFKKVDLHLPSVDYQQFES